MAEPTFDIYETPEGYVAVTNPVRRRILDALEGGGLELGDLVELTDRSKSTLSGVHLKDLRQKHLVGERPHPTDGRRKIYVLEAERLGASTVPVDRLRSAVKAYVTESPLAARVPLADPLAALAAAPEGTEPAILQAQGAHLGVRSARFFEAGDLRELLRELTAFLEREGLVRTLRIDLEEGGLAVVPGDALADVPAALLAPVLAGFVEGVAGGRGLPVAGASWREEGGRIEVTLPSPRDERPTERSV